MASASLTADFSIVDPYRMMGTLSLLSEGLLSRSYVHSMYRSISLQTAVSRLSLTPVLTNSIDRNKALQILNQVWTFDEHQVEAKLLQGIDTYDVT